MRHPDMCNVILSLISRLKTIYNAQATRKSSEDTEEHGFSAVTNPEEAKDHIMDLEALMKNMKEKIEAGDMTDLLKQPWKI